MDDDFLKKANHLFDEDEDLSVLPESNESIPDFIYDQMKEDGLFKDECNSEVDNYINENALEVILDLDFWRKNPNKFIKELKKAIDLDLDSIVDSVIKDFPREKRIIETILLSKKSKYIAKAINMPKDVYEGMIEGKEDVEKSVESFILSRKIAWWAPQRIIVNTKNEKWIGFLLESRFKLHLTDDELKYVLANRELFVKNFSGLSRKSDKLRIIRMGNLEYVSMLLECDGSYLREEEQNAIFDVALSNKRDDFIFKLIEIDGYFSDCIVEQIAKLGREDFILKLIENKVSQWVDFSPIINLGKKEYIFKILERDNLYVKTRKEIIRTKNLECISKLLEKYEDDACFLDFDMLLKLGKKEYILKKLESDDVDWRSLSNIVQLRDDELIEKVLEKKELHNLVQVEIVKYGKKEQIFKLIDRDDLGFLAKEEIKSTGNLEYISKLSNKEASCNQKKTINVSGAYKTVIYNGKFRIEISGSKVSIYDSNGKVLFEE